MNLQDLAVGRSPNQRTLVIGFGLTQRGIGVLELGLGNSDIDVADLHHVVESRVGLKELPSEDLLVETALVSHRLGHGVSLGENVGPLAFLRRILDLDRQSVDDRPPRADRTLAGAGFSEIEPCFRDADLRFGTAEGRLEPVVIVQHGDDLTGAHPISLSNPQFRNRCAVGRQRATQTHNAVFRLDESQCGDRRLSARPRRHHRCSKKHRKPESTASSPGHRRARQKGRSQPIHHASFS
jgi:hypothetical protein